VAKKGSDNDRILDVDGDRVVWKFRFEYQFNRSEPPWWQRIDEVNPRPAPVTNTVDSTSEWQMTGSGPTTTFQSAEERKQPNGLSTSTATEDDLMMKIHECETCNGLSSCPYSHRMQCLDETCKEWDVCINDISKSSSMTLPDFINNQDLILESLIQTQSLV
jgi:hypothetical protein